MAIQIRCFKLPFYVSNTLSTGNGLFLDRSEMVEGCTYIVRCNDEGYNLINSKFPNKYYTEFSSTSSINAFDAFLDKYIKDWSSLPLSFPNWSVNYLYKCGKHPIVVASNSTQVSKTYTTQAFLPLNMARSATSGSGEYYSQYVGVYGSISYNSETINCGAVTSLYSKLNLLTTSSLDTPELGATSVIANLWRTAVNDIGTGAGWIFIINTEDATKCKYVRYMTYVTRQDSSFLLVLDRSSAALYGFFNDLVDKARGATLEEITEGTTYTITTTIRPENAGTISYNKDKYNSGDSVTATLNSNVYQIESVTGGYVGETGPGIINDIAVGTNAFNFTMPSGNALIEVVLTKKEANKYYITSSFSPALSGTFNLSGTALAEGMQGTGIGTIKGTLISHEGTYLDSNNVRHNLSYTLTTPSVGSFMVNFTMPAGNVFFLFTVKIEQSVDPNNQGGTSTPGGGGGAFDSNSDIVVVPPLPNVNAAQSGFVSIYRPSLSQLEALGGYLWTNITDFIENLQKLFSNPMDCIIALNVLPVTPEVGPNRNIKLGLWETDIAMPPVLSQWYEHDCGTLQVVEYWGSALDYNPYTKITLMLPFIGSVPLDTDEIMGNTLGVKYRIDLLSGHCVAMLTVNGNVLYQFTGECAANIPLTGADWSRVYSAIASTALSGATLAAGSAGATATTAIGASRSMIDSANAVSNLGNTFSSLNLTSKGVKGVVNLRNSVQAAADVALEGANIAANAVNTANKSIAAANIVHSVGNTVSAVMGSKVNVSHSGQITGSAGMLGVQSPHILIEYPRQSLPENYKHFMGYPCNEYGRLGSYTGFTRCEQVELNGIRATDSEIAQILEALKEGVYL